MNDTSLRNRLLTNDARNSPAFSSQQHSESVQPTFQLTRRVWRGERTDGGGRVEDGSSPEPHVWWHRFCLTIVSTGREKTQSASCQLL
jgi:3',5'-cyclic AMP phosphodiesterase CpdA